MIFVFIAASYTPVAALVLEPPSSTIVLVSVWAGALLGVVFSIAWIDAPRLAVALAYIGVGWVIVIALPEILDDVGAAPTALFLAGGLLYSGGAVVYARKRPDPWPRTFGFHELFHALVIAAAAAPLRRDGRVGDPGRGLRPDPAFAAGDEDGLRAIGGAELRVDVVQVAAHRARGDAEVVRDLLVDLRRGEALQHLALLVRQR